MWQFILAVTIQATLLLVCWSTCKIIYRFSQGYSKKLQILISKKKIKLCNAKRPQQWKRQQLVDRCNKQKQTNKQTCTRSTLFGTFFCPFFAQLKLETSYSSYSYLSGGIIVCAQQKFCCFYFFSFLENVNSKEKLIQINKHILIKL